MKIRQQRKFRTNCVPVRVKAPFEYKMDRWDYSKEQSEQKFLGKVTITVETEAAREQVLLALQYLHNRWDIDTDYMAVNRLVHIYTHPECVVVGVEE